MNNSLIIQCPVFVTFSTDISWKVLMKLPTEEKWVDYTRYWWGCNFQIVYLSTTDESYVDIKASDVTKYKPGIVGEFHNQRPRLTAVLSPR